MTKTLSRPSSGWDLLDALDNPRPADIHAALVELGVEVVRECDKAGESEILAHCPMHKARTGKADRHPSFWVNSSSGAFICFSCEYKGAFTQLVMDALGYTQAQAGRWIITRRAGAARRRRDDDGPRKKLYTVAEPEYARMGEPPMDELKARGLTRLAAQAYGVRWRDGAWVLPIRGPHGDLMGWQEKRGHTFLNRPVDVTKSATLFGWNRFVKGSVAILTESPLCAVRIGSVGIPGAVAAFGVMVSDAQMRLIKQNARSLILALDNPFIDRAGRQAMEQIYRRWSGYGLDIRVFNYADKEGKDPGELSNKEIEHGIETACKPWRMSRVYR